MYYVDKTVAFSEVSPDYGIKLTQMLDYFQDVTILQSEERSVGVRALRDRGMCWVLSSWQVIVNRYPRLEEKIQVGTAPYEFKGFMGSRNFIIKTMDGEVLAKANSIWSFVDTQAMSLLRIPQDVVDAYNLEEKLEMDYAPRKIRLPESMTALEPFEVMYHNIDINAHVNNAQYIAMAEDLIPEGRRAVQLRTEYRASAKLGDTIYPFVNVSEDKKVFTISLANEEKVPYVIVEFTV